MNTDHGAVRVSVDLSEVAAEGIGFDTVSAELAGGGRFLAEELTVVGHVAEAEIHGVATGFWQLSVALYDDGVQLAAKRLDITVHKGKTTAVSLAARAADGAVVLETADEGQPGDPGDPGEPGEPGGPRGPGDGDDEEEPGDDDPDPVFRIPPAVTREVRHSVGQPHRDPDGSVRHSLVAAGSHGDAGGRRARLRTVRVDGGRRSSPRVGD